MSAGGSAVGRIAQAAVRRAIDGSVERVRDALPGVVVEAGEDALVLSARGLTARVVDDAALRWIGELVR